MAKKQTEEIGYYLANIHKGVAAQYRYWSAEDIQAQIRCLREYRLTWSEIADHVYPGLAEGSTKVSRLAGKLPRRLSFLTEGIRSGFAGSYSTYRENSGPRENRV